MVEVLRAAGLVWNSNRSTSRAANASVPAVAQHSAPLSAIWAVSLRVASWMNRNGAAEIARAYTESRRLRFRLIVLCWTIERFGGEFREPRRIWRFLTAGGIALAASSVDLAVVSSTLAEADQLGQLE